ncbi:ECF-type sigma factor [Stieleria sp. ICT_E10.1]|uniref:ECF-type sigma factor n=1 Tax=Stieleria sedimenti TaxID=2976331 RepID=UPI00217FF8C2|nr:ECF-type sigma factor [Stieleria sedimenti]MCS7466119.1 ECF-type sigma factor [Stieleria sedimenti]
MTDVTKILVGLVEGTHNETRDLLPLVYQQLRTLARSKLARERDGISIDATELVHDAFLRLIGNDAPISWESRAQFFAAAAEAMRRILIERARERETLKRGGDRKREPFHEQIASEDSDKKLFQLNDALDRLEQQDPERAKLVKLRYFVGFTVAEAAQLLGISKTKAERSWVFTRAWLQTEMTNDELE